MTISDLIDPITVEIIHNALGSVVDEFSWHS